MLRLENQQPNPSDAESLASPYNDKKAIDASQLWLFYISILRPHLFRLYFAAVSHDREQSGGRD
jgi:hypothetical protein